VTTAALKEKGIVPKASEGVKLLMKGELKAKLSIDVERASKNASAAIEKLGGSVKVAPVLPKREKVKKDPKTGKAIKA
jgi:large subunit ribosomal protein L15